MSEPERGDVRPAMSAEEWASVREKACLDCYTFDKKIPVSEFVEPEDISRHALAALCLHGQPFGFTWEDADVLRALIGFADMLDRPVLKAMDLADRIEALLPPVGLQGEGEGRG